MVTALQIISKVRAGLTSVQGRIIWFWFCVWIRHSRSTLIKWKEAIKSSHLGDCLGLFSFHVGRFSLDGLRSVVQIAQYFLLLRMQNYGQRWLLDQAIACICVYVFGIHHLFWAKTPQLIRHNQLRTAIKNRTVWTQDLWSSRWETGSLALSSVQLIVLQTVLKIGDLACMSAAK